MRPVIDLRNLNCFVKYSHFKMEGIELVKSLVRREDFMVSIDLNQAFYNRKASELIASQQDTPVPSQVRAFPLALSRYSVRMPH